MERRLGEPNADMGAGHASPSRAFIPGLVVVAVVVVVARFVDRSTDVSSLVVAVVLGAIAANAGLIRPVLRPGLAFAGRRLLRIGVVLLGLRLSFDDIRGLGIVGAVSVIVVVLLAFLGVQHIARLLGLSSGIGLLTATGFSICGASAIAAMAPLSGADEEETAYAIALVTLFGSLAIALLPPLGHLFDMPATEFGAWVGAGVHDVGQVTATASAYSDRSLAIATLVKLTRVVMLAPMVAIVGVARRRDDSTEGANPAILPLFVVGFLAAIGLRATAWLSPSQLEIGRHLENVTLTAGMFALGAGVEIVRLRRLGGKPLVLGFASWALVALLALGAAYVSI
ncbi:MAG: putative sulfate exporter family transporter [Ilumatobacteraceae bacterium]|nr:putative sulfate exporter family transporter [Ilumatobacteraceae bacterium]